MAQRNSSMSLRTVRRRRGPATVIVALAVALALPAPAFAVTGVLTETHGDRLDGTETPETYSVATPEGTYAVAGDPPGDLVGRTVTIDASARGRGGPRAVTSDAAAKAVAAAGPQSLLVIITALPDAAAQTITPEQARAAVFTDATSTSALFAQQSGGAMTLGGRVRADGDVTGPYLLPVSGAGCPTDAIADAADRAAAAGGWSPASYDHVLYVLPRLTTCDWAGLGQMPGRRAWTNGYLETSVVAHELGHNLGAHHASSLRCAGAGGAAVALSASCSASEYGDPFDVMGLQAHLMSSWHRAQVAELPADRQRTATQSGTFPIVSADAIGAMGTQLLLVPRKQPGRPVTSYLAVERRSPLGPFDAFDSIAPVSVGFSIRVVPALNVSSQSLLVDATPETASVLDSPLLPGRTFADDLGGISIAALDAGTVQVTMPPLVDDVPPTPPELMRLESWAGVVHVSWSPATDDTAVDHYDIERDGAVVAGRGAEATGFDDVVPGPRTVSYRVVAVDAAGNRGATNAGSVWVPAPARDSSTGGASLRPVHPRPRVGRLRLRSSKVRHSRRGWSVTIRVTALHATRMSATVGGRRVALSHGPALTVRFRYPYGARRRTLIVRAGNERGNRRATWTYR
ncbi:MAG: Peptidase gametolysin [Conexibacter sp.]|nr:Peptidase gametolysin [Conexibacter sp.]